jgi:hypothetical protein
MGVEPADDEGVHAHKNQSNQPTVVFLTVTGAPCLCTDYKGKRENLDRIDNLSLTDAELQTSNDRLLGAVAASRSEQQRTIEQAMIARSSISASGMTAGGLLIITNCMKCK